MIDMKSADLCQRVGFVFGSLQGTEYKNPCVQRPRNTCTCVWFLKCYWRLTNYSDKRFPLGLPARRRRTDGSSFRSPCRNGFQVL